VAWIHLAQDRNQLQVRVNALMNTRVDVDFELLVAHAIHEANRRVKGRLLYLHAKPAVCI
jgi:hypothetical protein